MDVRLHSDGPVPKKNRNLLHLVGPMQQHRGHEVVQQLAGRTRENHFNHLGKENSTALQLEPPTSLSQLWMFLQIFVVLLKRLHRLWPFNLTCSEQPSPTTVAASLKSSSLSSSFSCGVEIPDKKSPRVPHIPRNPSQSHVAYRSCSSWLPRPALQDLSSWWPVETPPFVGSVQLSKCHLRQPMSLIHMFYMPKGIVSQTWQPVLVLRSFSNRPKFDFNTPKPVRPFRAGNCVRGHRFWASWLQKNRKPIRCHLQLTYTMLGCQGWQTGTLAQKMFLLILSNPWRFSSFIRFGVFSASTWYLPFRVFFSFAW